MQLAERIERMTENSAMDAKSTRQHKGISVVHGEVQINFDYGAFAMT
jgi:hypothetical protein